MCKVIRRICIILSLIKELACSKVLRLPCVHYADFQQTHGYMVEGSSAKQFKTIENTDLMRCGQACMFNEKCNTATFFTDTHACHLLRESDFTQVTNQIAVLLTTPEKDNKRIGPICEEGESPCLPGQFCRDVCDQNNDHTYLCLDNNNAARWYGTATQSHGTNPALGIDENHNTHSYAAYIENGAYWYKVDVNHVFFVYMIRVKAVKSMWIHAKYDINSSLDDSVYTQRGRLGHYTGYYLWLDCNFIARYIKFSAEKMPGAFQPYIIYIFV